MENIDIVECVSFQKYYWPQEQYESLNRVNSKFDAIH